MSEENKQVEEAAINYAEQYNMYRYNIPGFCHNSFIAGANWQSQHSYTKEEILNILEALKSICEDEAMNFHFSPSNISEIQERFESIDLKQFLKKKTILNK